MTLYEWLQSSMVRLKNAGVDSPRRDCLVLIEDILHKDRAWVLAHHEEKLSPQQLKILNALLERRIAREPLAYIRGKAWFYKRFFKVNPSVLTPRPESEAFIEIIKDIKPKKLFDIGTGSGCIAISAKLELSNCDVIATDIDADALEITKENAQKHKVNLGFIQTNLLQGFEKFDFSNSVVAANLPYVPDGKISSPEIEAEPAQALFAGEDGLDYYLSFCAQLSALSKKPEYVLTESLESQHQAVESIARKAGYKLWRTETLVQAFIRT